MLKNSITLFLIAVISALSVTVMAQNIDDVNILPPPPNAASLGKFAGVTNSLSSGAANYSIPLMTYNSKNLSMPISLSYTTNGFKVDEIASRVGNQWRLNAGGVISRTVLGSVDESTTRMSPHNPLGDKTDPTLYFFARTLSSTSAGQGVGPTGDVDGQPDIFTFDFNGYNGKFILDTIGVNKTLAPVMLTNNGLKISWAQQALKFTIITPDGITYLFGGIGATESSVNNGSCGAGFDNVPTAWYLKTITHPNGDVINFYYSPIVYSYSTGRSESVYAYDGQYASCVSSTSIPSVINTSCTNSLQTTGVLLDSITSTFGDKVKLNYISRTDNNDKLLSSITIYSSDHTTNYKNFNLTYTYSHSRPFLTQITESDGSSVIAKVHKFGYSDLSNVPSQLSYSQDYWGYFNGKTNSSTVPKPKDPDFAQALPAATANRDPDPIYAAKGLLNSVTFPTGGKDSIIYEGNQAYMLTTVYPVQTSTSDRATTTTNSLLTVDSSPFTISYTQQTQFSGSCTATSTTYNSTRSSNFYILDANNGIIYSKLYLPGESFNLNINLTVGTYKLRIVAYGDKNDSKSKIVYRAGLLSTPTMNVNIGGVRVSKILTYDGISSVPIIKKYYYNSLSAPDQSSAYPDGIPVYERMFSKFVQCVTGAGACTGAAEYRWYFSSTNSIFNLFRFQSPTVYQDVTEGFGENFENGGIEHTYTSQGGDNEASIFLGSKIFGASTGNESYRNGFETYQGVFKLLGSQRIYTKKVLTHYQGLKPPSYSIHPDFDMAYTGYVCTQNYNCYCNPPFVNQTLTWLQKAYNVSYYKIYKAWVYADTVKTYNYDLDGINYTLNTSIVDFNNVSNPNPSVIKSLNSTGDTLKIAYSYPTDFQSVAPYADMVAKNIIKPIVIKAQYNNSTPIDYVRTNYYDWGNNNYLPQTIEYKKGIGNYETRLRFYNYDNEANLQCVGKEGGTKVTYIWGYDGKCPIARVENAEYSSVISVLGGATAVANFRNIKRPTDAQVLSFLAPLRSSAILSGAIITTETFDPINGITRTADPNGISTFYEYDSLLRLMNIKDNDGNITKHIDYHYQGQ